jgi:cholesterol transport system auxiliary component
VTRLHRLAPLVLAVCAAGCTGSLFKSKVPPPTIYLLGASATAAAAKAASATAAAAKAASPIPVDLAVLKPRLRPGLESDRIAALYPDRRLDYFADARWNGPLGEVLQDVAVQAFHTRAALRNVSGEASVFASAYWLEIEVTDFQAEYTAGASAPTVHVQFLARLGTSGDRRILGQFTAIAEQPAAENRLTAIVDAYAQATDTVLAKLVADVGATLAKPLETR